MITIPLDPLNTMILFWKRNPTHNCSRIHFLITVFQYGTRYLVIIIRNSPSIQSFKSLYRNYLFNKNLLFVLLLYMFSLLLDLWVYVSVCRFSLYNIYIFLFYYFDFVCLYAPNKRWMTFIMLIYYRFRCCLYFVLLEGYLRLRHSLYLYFILSMPKCYNR